MRIDLIDANAITLTIEAGEAFRLAQACEAAAEVLRGNQLDGEVFGLPPQDTGTTVARNHSHLFAALHAAFFGCAIAAEDRMEHPVGWDKTLTRLGRYVTTGGGTR